MMGKQIVLEKMGKPTVPEKLARLLAEYPSRLFFYDVLYLACWGDTYHHVCRNTIHVQISMARKLLPGKVLNYRNAGYMYVV